MVIVHICSSCGARIKEDHFQGHCPMCKRKDAKFDKIHDNDPSDDDHHYTKKYHEVVKKLEEYTDGCEPVSLEDYED